MPQLSLLPRLSPLHEPPVSPPSSPSPTVLSVQRRDPLPPAAGIFLMEYGEERQLKQG